MSLSDKLMDELKAAMKARDTVRVSTIRLLRGQLKDRRIDKGADLTEEEELAVLSNAAKKRKEAIEAYEKGGRSDLAEKERQELAIIETFLPTPLSEAEIERIVEQVIAEVGASGLQDLGAVMKDAMSRLKGRADGRLVQALVRRKLGA